MADSASEFESDTSSIDGGPVLKSSLPGHIEHLNKRIDSLQQENRVLRVELETYKMKCRTLQEDNRELRRASVTIQARAEQEEEFISNTLLKKIDALKKEKEMLAMNYEQEEEFLTNDLSKKLMQLRQEKVELEQTLEKEQEYQVNKLMRRIQKLQSETESKQATLEQLRREKVELENALEQEQEALVNRLWKKMDKLETEKRTLQEKLEQPVSQPASPLPPDDNVSSLSNYVQTLRGEVTNLRAQLVTSQAEYAQKMAQCVEEEKLSREENTRLQRKLQMEIERRENLCRHLSESESSLEMDDERHFNEMTKQHEKMVVGPSVTPFTRPRTASSPIPMAITTTPRPLSPGGSCGLSSGPIALSPPSPIRCAACMMQMTHGGIPPYPGGTSPPASMVGRGRPDRTFRKPSLPLPAATATVTDMLVQSAATGGATDPT